MDNNYETTHHIPIATLVPNIDPPANIIRDCQELARIDHQIQRDKY